MLYVFRTSRSSPRAPSRGAGKQAPEAIGGDMNVTNSLGSHKCLLVNVSVFRCVDSVAPQL